MIPEFNPPQFGSLRSVGSPPSPSSQPSQPAGDEASSSITAPREEEIIKTVRGYALQKTDGFFARYALAKALGHNFFSCLWLVLFKTNLADALQREISSANLPTLAGFLGMRQYKGEYVIKHYFKFNGNDCFVWMYPDVKFFIEKDSNEKEYVTRTLSRIEWGSVFDEIQANPMASDAVLDLRNGSIKLQAWNGASESGIRYSFAEEQGLCIAFKAITLSQIRSDRNTVGSNERITAYYLPLPSDFVKKTKIQWRKSDGEIRDATEDEIKRSHADRASNLVAWAEGRPVYLTTEELNAEGEADKTKPPDSPAGVSK
ncbi:MAG: hypothetical protein LBH53_02135 [Puniceicoccales bacterium]|nr:hypothetical protein [Puniceicoccales bacterium]